MSMDSTHALDLRSWVESSDDPQTDFPIQNLPLGMFSRDGVRPRAGIAIGDAILDLTAAASANLLSNELADVVGDCTRAGALNPLLAAGRGPLRALRAEASALLSADSPAGRRASGRVDLLVPQRDARLHLPAHVGDYTDFYASINHATNVGSMFRPDNALLPNYKWVPIGYHGRASSIVPSGTPIIRPVGQSKEEGADAPVVRPSRRMDYELEMGVWIAGGNQLGERVRITEADELIGGLSLVNDWSARDVQAWEYQPLGPFLAKSFATSVSPWIVTLDALEPFRTNAFRREVSDPQPLEYLSSTDDAERGGFAITLEVLLTSQTMREQGVDPMLVSRGSFTEMYWTIAQLVTHHASNGCNLRAGDLLGSGTVSGPAPDSRGCLLERTWKGTEPLALPTGETRAFLADGDTVTLRGSCARDGYRRIGFGEVSGTITPARA